MKCLQCRVKWSSLCHTGSQTRGARVPPGIQCLSEDLALMHCMQRCCQEGPKLPAFWGADTLQGTELSPPLPTVPHCRPHAAAGWLTVGWETQSTRVKLKQQSGKCSLATQELTMQGHHEPLRSRTDITPSSWKHQGQPAQPQQCPKLPPRTPTAMPAPPQGSSDSCRLAGKQQF